MKIALWQTRPRSDVAAALDALAEAADQAAQAGADLLLTPEMAIGGYNIGAEAVAAHASEAERILAALAEIARTTGIALVAGLPLPGAPRPFNSCVALDATGAERARYHKTHLFGQVDRDQFAPGRALSDVFMLAGWRVSLAICYDIEFPELARALARNEADLILTPTANMAPFDSVATRLVPARAEENALFVAYCNYVGREGRFDYNGLSCLCGPDGADLARADGTAQTLLFAELDRAALIQTRETQTHLHDRRSDLY
ncbi:MAG: carbon-nitrogen hydrolase family protein [Rhodobiaceae bacterium]|nr:carbon-nitrogen hydrolase family protein [Rhodobiaceae bacterium]